MAAPGDRKQRILAVAQVSHVLTREVMMDRCMKTRTRTRSEGGDIPAAAAGRQHSPNGGTESESDTESDLALYNRQPVSTMKINNYKD